MFKPFQKSVRAAIFFLLLVVLMLQGTTVKAQQSGVQYNSFGAKAHYGLIIPHTEDLKQLSGTHPVGFQLDWSRLSTTQKAWEHCNCYAKVGASFTYFNYQWPDVLGSSYNLIAFGEPYLLRQRNFSLSLRGGLGITYLDQVYDEVDNPLNTFYSSPISFIILAKLGLNYKLNEQWDFSLAASYNHISNGGISSPNKGMNFPTLGLGMDYYPRPIVWVERERVSFERWTTRPYGRFFITRRGVEEDNFTDRKSMLLFGLAAGVQARVAKMHAISTGIEAFRDNALSVEARRRGIKQEPYVLGWAVGHHLLFGKFDFNQQMVYYLYKPFPFNDKLFYQRYELTYQFMPNWLAGISLLAHGNTAQNIDLRLGFIF